MTTAMHIKFNKAVREFRSVFPDLYVHDWRFRHYGKYYRIEEDSTKYSIYLVNPTGIHDTLVETITK